jgi:response regulator NasT
MIIQAISPAPPSQKPILMNSEKTRAQHSEKAYSVLVVDDSRTMADLLSMNLRRAGHRVCGIARDGREAVKMALKLHPDVIIMDIQMPVLDGLDAAREILRARQVPIVLSTGLSDVGSIQRAIDLQIISYLIKPFTPVQLNVAIRFAVEQCRKLAEFDLRAAA